MTQSGIHHGLPENIIQKILDILAGYPAIEQVILYGSRAKGNYRSGSDIDLCLQAPTLQFSQQLEIENRLDDLLLPWKIDLTLRHNIENPALQEHIERVGVSLMKRSSTCGEKPEKPGTDHN